MSLRRAKSPSILSVLLHKQIEYNDLYDSDCTTSALVKTAEIDVIERTKAALMPRPGCGINLYELLRGMLKHAPSLSGQRYVAVVLQIAGEQGSEAVVNVGMAWFHRLFLPMMGQYEIDRQKALSESRFLCPTDTPRFGNQMQFRYDVALRENHCCIITGTLDIEHVQEMISRGQVEDISVGRRRGILNAARILPLYAHDSEQTGATSQQTADHTWDILEAWAGIDIRQLVGDRSYSAENAIFMTEIDHMLFGQFIIYFEDFPDLPNQYTVQVAQRNGHAFSDGNTHRVIRFSDEAQTGVRPPNPRLISVHASIAKALRLSGAAAYVDNFDQYLSDNSELRADGTTDIASHLIYKIPHQPSPTVHWVD